MTRDETKEAVWLETCRVFGHTTSVPIEMQGFFNAGYDVGLDAGLSAQRDWVAVSERIPADGVRALICYKNGRIDISAQASTWGIGFIVAWMPIDAIPPYSPTEAVCQT